MAVRGKHARTSGSAPNTAESGAPRHARFEPAFDVPESPERRSPQIVAIIVLAALLALIPFSIRVASSVDAQAFADSTRDAFPLLADSGVEQPAASFGLFLDLLAEDAQPTEEQSAPVAPVRYTERVTAELQSGVMEGGCELVALDIALDAMGLDADVRDIADNHLDVDGHFATGYSGSPYVRGGGYAEGIVKAANSYLAARGEAVRAHNLTGYAFGQLEDIVDKGYPVLVWTTMGFADPEFAGAFDNGMEWYNNEHCVVLYDYTDSKAYVSDPLSGLVERDLARFQEIYEKCGSMAVAIY